jgi:hypothetical protein
MSKLKCIFLLAFLLSSRVYAGSFSASLENDLVFKNDRHYTHGTRLCYVDNNNNGYAIGQYLYTPSDISVKEAMTNDRPFGGWLYAGFSNFKVKDNIYEFGEIDIGMIGPHSYVEETQKKIHEWTGSKTPQGWNNQLKDEIGIDAIYQRKHKWDYNIIDIIPHYGGCLGNAHTYLNVGCMGRLGYNLPDNFGFLRMEPTARANFFSCYLFSEVDGRYVARNIFLDGNTFEDSYSVDKEELVGDLAIGVGIIYNRFEIAYAETYRSKEFELQEESDEFGTIMLSWRF